MKPHLSIISHSEAETLKTAKRLAKNLAKGDILFLKGNLGSGKTTFTKGLCEGLGISQAEVKSPTFVLMHEYEGRLPVYHFDLYRLEREEQLDELDADLFFYGRGVSVVEWSDRIQKQKPKQFLEVEFKHAGEKERQLVFSPFGKHYETLLRGLEKLL